MSYFRLLSTVIVSSVLVLLVACSGGETGTGVQPNQQTTIGAITGFGSVHVNGVRFATDASTNFQINNASGDESGLAHGMVVAVVGTVDPSGTTGTATEIRYAYSMVGIVFDNTLLNPAPGTTLDVMGYTINVGADTVYDNSSGDSIYPTLNTVPNGGVVEVSGFRLISSNSIHATRIELKNAQYSSSQSVFVKGAIKSVDDITKTFDLLGSNLVIDYSAANIEQGVLVPFKIVSVEMRSETPSIPPESGDTYFATKIEAFTPDEDEFDDGDEVEIEGVVTSSFDAITKEFSLNGLVVLVGENVEFKCANPDFSTIKEGMKLEVEGVYNGFNVLVAEKMQCRQDAEIEITAFVNSIDLNNNRFTLMGQPVIVDDLTIIKDDTSVQPDKEFDFTKLLVGDLVEISVFVDDTTSALMVTNLVRKDSDPTKPFEFEFSGPITGSVNNASDPTIVDSISAAGIDFDVSQLDSKINSAAIGIGNNIEIKGEYNGSQQPSLTVNEVSL